MGKKDLARRLLSLFLAAQLLCMQLPLAFAFSPESEPPAAELSEGEEPVPAGQAEGEEQSPPAAAEPADEPENASAAAAEQQDETLTLYAYKIGYGLPFSSLDGGRKVGLNDYDDYFAVETAATVMDGYGQRDYARQDTLPLAEEGGEYRTFCVFPAPEALGRVPDKKFVGWYLYPAGADKSDPISWVYADGMREIDTLPYTSADLGYADYGGLGDRWNGPGANYAGDGYLGNEDGPINLDNPVSFVGRWAPSSVARAAGEGGKGAQLTFYAGAEALEDQPSLYDRKIDGAPLPETPVEFSPDVTEYWLRVGANVTSLDLTFNAYESYYTYIRGGEGASPVAVTRYEPDGTTKQVFEGDRLAAKSLPEANWNEVYQEYTPTNSIASPAHSQWTVTGIALQPSAGGANLYNDLVVEVTAPDGVTRTAYTFHIQRLAEPKLARSPGNSPAGMIARDTGVEWGKTDTERAQNKAAALNYLRANYTFRAADRLAGTENQSGSVFRGNYGSKAWLGDNADMDTTALMVYQDASFLVPGISLTDAQGNAVDLADAKYAGSVTRTLKLRREDALTIGGVGDGLGTECWYADGALVNEQRSEAVNDLSGGDQIDLRGLKVLPGVYSLEYTYTDPVSGLSYRSDGGGFSNPSQPNHKDAFRRTLVVLPAPGDVDMDGAVTSADAEALERAQKLTGGIVTSLNNRELSTDAAAALFAYRVCDLTHSNDVRADDLDYLKAGFAPVLNKLGDSDYYYIPLPTGETESRYTRRLLDTAPTGDAARLTMEFLGKERGKLLSTGATDGPQGPVWAAGDTEGVELGDTFWLGVRLSDSANSAVLNQSVNSFTFTLTYDAHYVTPAVVLDQTALDSVGSVPLDRWKATMRVYNLSGRSETIWGSGSTYDLTAAAGDAKAYTTHYSKAITPLEQHKGVETELKELVFSIRLNPNSPSPTPQSLQQDGYLLVVPFTLIRHPYGQTSAQLVEMGAGMRDFVFVGQQSSGFSLLSLLTGQGQTDAAAAYSAQDTIFGGSTANLRDSVGYDGAGAAIPLGENKTETILLHNEYDSPAETNAIYSTPFKSTNGGQLPANAQSVMGVLPPGIAYDGHTLAGTPTEAGVYEFSIAGQPYRIVVEKAVLHFWADNQASYYGQSEFRGGRNSGFTFRYETGDILSIDRARAQAAGAVPDGDGAKLAALLADSSYTPPAFAAYKGESPVEFGTGVGIYPIRCDLLPMSKNYQFIFTPEAAGGSKGLTILQRPFQVKKLAAGTEVGEIYSDMPGVLPGLSASLSAASRGFEVALPPATGESGYYNGYPLTAAESADDPAGVLVPGDELAITYTGTYRQTPEDIAGTGFFTLKEGEVRAWRNVEVSALKLTVGTANYSLVGEKPTEQQEDREVIGFVTRRNIESIRISQTPSLTYRYGDQLGDSSALHFYIKKGDTTEGEFAYNPLLKAELGISVTWATAAQKANHEPGDIDYVQGQIFDVPTFIGRYLCVSAPSVDKDGKENVIVSYSESPLTVTPLTLTLTSTAAERYYGEENGTLTFTYRVDQLAGKDRQGRTLKGEGAELAEVLQSQGYTPPSLSAVVSATDATPVTARTPAGQSYVVTISGAACNNYVFRYALPGGATSSEKGYSPFKISKRMIVVSALAQAKRGDLATVYADTRRIYTEGLVLSLSDVAVALPAHTETTTSYFPRYGTPDSNPRTAAIGYATDTAILTGDELAFTYTATVVPLRDKDFVNYSSFTKGYYDMSGASEDGAKSYPVQVSDLKLTGAAVNNYELTYRTNGDAMKGLPGETQLLSGVNPELGYTDYYIAGTGRVLLRPIESITILSVSKMAYTYGEPFTPTVGSPEKLKVSLNYARTYDNYAGNITSEIVTYEIDSYTEEGEPVSSFDDRSLSICWVAGGQSEIDENQVLTYGQYVTATEHNGARLAVVGRRGKNDPLVKSALTTEALTVKPRPLVLTAASQNRCYGEENAPVLFTFAESALAKPDREILRAKGLTGADGDGALQALGVERDFAYTAPAGSTTATAGSKVLDSGRGSYPIQLSGGSLSNYTLQYVPGALHVYPRPVKISKFISSSDRPIYTIYADTEARSFDTNVTNRAAAGAASFEMVLPNAQGYVIPGTEELLPVTGDAICGNDEIPMKITVYYYQLPPGGSLPSGASGAEHRVQVTAASILPGTAAASNYVLETAGSSGKPIIVDPNAIGMVELRSINSIEIKDSPAKLTYQYSESLDLTGLTVTIDYDVISGESNKKVDVKYVGADQFAQYGLYVNYIGTRAQQTSALDYKSLRRAESGDHLTIAPTHDSQFSGSSFTANGKYLVVSGQLHAAHPPAVPQTVQTPITVKPLPIQFTLSAGDKTYDGTTAAVGSMTFQNIFQADGVVDAYHSSGVWDMVYPVTGADYEGKWSTLSSGYADFKTYLSGKGKEYTFTTGTYRPAGAAPLGENYPLDYTAGYEYGTGLTFRFLDPNVAYREEPSSGVYGALGTVNVQVAGISLRGPDAANYTLLGGQSEITPENVADAEGYQSAELPEATIHKANRATLPTAVLPQAELDVHSNAVRLTYAQGLSAIGGGEAAAYEDELRFEYALQYASVEESYATLAQWAGMDGAEAWWDKRFFGGEAYSPAIPAGYVPDESDIPKEEKIKEDTVLKGQLYRWSEDEDFFLDVLAYPGASIWPGYYLYATSRSPLPRNTVVLPVVRAAETHNYNASPVLTSVEDYTPALVQAVADANADVQAAERAREEAVTPEDLAGAEAALTEARAGAQSAANDALAAAAPAVEGAQAAAQAERDQLLEIADSGKWPEDWTETPAAPAVKTYTQHISVVSTERKQSGAGAERAEYTVPTLEAVWFTDVLDYPESRVMDAVLRNNGPTRYYRYAWDSSMSALLEFNDKEKPFSLADPLEVEIKTQGADGKEVTETVTVNEGNTAIIYADTSSGGGLIKEKAIRIEPRALFAAVGDAPLRLTATVTPKYATYKNVTWTSSNAAVATVDKDGVVTFVGPGVAMITATSRFKLTDSITVTVVANWRDRFPNSIFDLGRLAAFFELEDDRFWPERGMTRGEAVEVLARFYVPNENWTHTGSGAFPDLTGSEPYADEARLLGSVGVIAGMPDGSFDGERPITRAEFIALLARMLGVDVPSTKGQPHAFQDAGEGDTWAYSYIDAMNGVGILNGVGGGSFVPGRVLTRVEAAVFLVRILRDGVDGRALGLHQPSDVQEDYWGYASILRAINGAEPKGGETDDLTP
jgi:hypothetical protein